MKYLDKQDMEYVDHMMNLARHMEDLFFCNIFHYTRRFLRDIWINRTWDAYYKNDKALIDIFDLPGYDLDNKKNKKELAKEIRNDDNLYKIERRYIPSYPLLFPIERSGYCCTEKKMILIDKKAPGIVIISDYYRNYYIAIVESRFEMSKQKESLAIAYSILRDT